MIQEWEILIKEQEIQVKIKKIYEFLGLPSQFLESLEILGSLGVLGVASLRSLAGSLADRGSPARGPRESPGSAPLPVGEAEPSFPPEPRVLGTTKEVLGLPRISRFSIGFLQAFLGFYQILIWISFCFGFGWSFDLILLWIWIWIWIRLDFGWIWLRF